MGPCHVRPWKVQALPKQPLCDDPLAVQLAHNSLEHLAKVARDFEKNGRGPEAGGHPKRCSGLAFERKTR